MLRKAQILLFYFLPISLITGPFLSDLSINIISIIFLIFSYKNNDWSYFTKSFSIFFFIWCLYLITRSLTSTNPMLSLESSLFYFRFGIFALAIAELLINQNFKILKIFSYILIVTFSLILTDAFLQYITEFNSLGYLYDQKRLSGFFGNEKKLGSYLVRLLPVLFSLVALYHKSSRFMFAFCMLLLIFTDILIYLSGERVAFFFLILFSISVLALVKNWKMMRLITFIISIGCIVYISATNDKIKSRMIDYTYWQTNTGTTFSLEHDILYETALNMFYHQPVFGVGPKLFREKCKIKSYRSKIHSEYTDNNPDLNCNSHPHNTYIQLLAETGIVGTAPVLFLFILITYYFIKQLYTLYIVKKPSISDEKICIMLGMYIAIWPLAPSGNFFNNWLNIFLYINAGIFIAFLGRKKFS